MEQLDDDLPDVHFGTVGAKSINWRKAEDEFDPDDEVLKTTPSDVVALLGFDPLVIDDGDAI